MDSRGTVPPTTGWFSLMPSGVASRIVKKRSEP
jgi:hypothetical protein